MPAPEPISAPGKSLAASRLRRISSSECRPVQAHAALRGVHRLGDAEAERPQMPPERDGRVPVDRGVEPRIAVGERIGDHMRGRIGDAVERRRGLGKFLRRAAWCRARSCRRPSGRFRVGIVTSPLVSRTSDAKRALDPATQATRASQARREVVHAGTRASLRCPVRRELSYLRHTFSAGMSIQRRSFQLLCAASTSCRPLAPSSSVHLNGASS